MKHFRHCSDTGQRLQQQEGEIHEDTKETCRAQHGYERRKSQSPHVARVPSSHTWRRFEAESQTKRCSSRR